MQNKQKRGCWKYWYRYQDAVGNRYQYRSSTASRYRYRFERYRCPVRIPIAHCILVPVPPTGFCPEIRDFGIFTHFFSTNLPQFVPYQKSTMESTQNNSKCGLESIKIPFPQVRAFHQNPNQKNEVRVLIFLTFSLQISSSMLFDPLGGRNGERITPKLDLSLTLAFFSLFSSLLLQNVICSYEP